jgi:predicted RNase H-like HicB family nuclease
VSVVNKFFSVGALWDEEANVWVAFSEEVPGLATEADTTETLAQKLKTLIPELLELNSQMPSIPIAFEFLKKRFVIE